MHKALVSLAVFAVAIFATATDASAMGFGRVRSAAVLGHPLNLVVPVRLDADETLGSECVNADVVSGDVPLHRSNVRAAVEPGNEPGERQIRITTLVTIDEPVVTVTVSAGCPPRLSRQFVTFADPPGLALAPPQPEAAAVPAPAPVTREAAPAARSDVAPAPTLESRTTTTEQARPRRTPRANAASAAPRGARARRDTTGAPGATARARPPTAPAAPRLRLEVAEAPPPADPQVVAAQEQASAAQAAASAAEAAASAANERARSLEQELAQARADAQAQRDSVAQLRSRLAEGDDARRWMPWLLLLLAALALLALWFGWRLKQVPRERWYRPSQQSELAESESSFAPVTTSAHATEVALAPVPPPVPAPPPPAPPHVPPPSMFGDAAPPADTMPQTLRPTVADAPDPQRWRAVSVEEQIDLEQQADFFLVLGQDEAAIDLLLTHLRGTGGTSPLPYLKLLEVYRRRGEQDPYERMRVRFNQRFNAVAPEWGGDLAAGRSLEDYPQVLQRLQQAWWSPLDAMAELESLLFRKGDDAERFELPAYQDIIFLYQLARDLHQHEQQTRESPSTAVDVLLPIGDADTASGVSVRHVDIETTRVMHAPRAQPLPTLDLDLSSDDDEPPSAERDSRLLDFDEPQKRKDV